MDAYQREARIWGCYNNVFPSMFIVDVSQVDPGIGSGSRPPRAGELYRIVVTLSIFCIKKYDNSSSRSTGTRWLRLECRFLSKGRVSGSDQRSFNCFVAREEVTHKISFGSMNKPRHEKIKPGFLVVYAI